MDVTGGRPCTPVCCDIRGGRLLGNGSEMSRRGAMPGGEKEALKGAASVCGVCGLDPASLPKLLRSLSPLLSSSSSRIKPKTRRTMFPTTSSRGCAAMSRLPTSWTFCISLTGSDALVMDTKRRSSSAVAMAQGFEPLICSRLSKLHKAWLASFFVSQVDCTHDIRVSIAVSTGSVLRLLINEGREGARETGFAGAMGVRRCYGWKTIIVLANCVWSAVGFVSPTSQAIDSSTLTSSRPASIATTFPHY